MARDVGPASASAAAPDELERRPADGRSSGRHRRSPGRPRDPKLDHAILTAAERQLRERGYSGMSIEAVAREAHTTVPTLRRRYRDKSALAAAVIDSIRVEKLPEQSGSARNFALAILENFRRNLRRRHSMSLLGTLLAEEHRQPALIERFRERMVAPRRGLLHDALAAGMCAGELDQRADIDVAVTMLIGAFYAAFVCDGEIPASWPERLINQVWPAPEVDPRLPTAANEACASTLGVRRAHAHSRPSGSAGGGGHSPH